MSARSEVFQSEVLGLENFVNSDFILQCKVAAKSIDKRRVVTAFFGVLSVQLDTVKQFFISYLSERSISFILEGSAFAETYCTLTTEGDDSKT